MTTYHIHEKHPLDVIEENEQAMLEKQLSKPLREIQFQILQAEVMLHLGRKYMYAPNKEKRARGWPVTVEECAKFLEKRGRAEWTIT